jgi:hypothetical protein
MFMTEYRRQVAFLKTLLSYSDDEEHRDLQERMAQTEKNEHCLLCACRLVGMIGAFGLMGLGYSAVLLPEFFHHSPHLLVQFFSALGLGSVMCLLVFVGLWFYYRSAVNRIHDECRRIVTRMLEARLRLAERTFFPTIVENPDLRVSAIRFITHTESTSLSVRKAS